MRARGGTCSANCKGIAMDRSSRGQVDAFIVMDMVAAARILEDQGRSVIHMEVGQPGTLAPVGARAAVAQALGARYTGIQGVVGVARVAPRDCSTLPPLAWH